MTQTLEAQPGVGVVQTDVGAGTATVAGQGYDVARLIAKVNSLGFEASSR